jgi:hypothetical protein
MTVVAIVLVGLVAFVVGWIARGRYARLPISSEDPIEHLPVAEPAPVLPTSSLFGTEPREVPDPPPDPAAATLRLLDRALAAYEAAVDRWLDEGDAITPAGRAALGELDRAVQRVDVAAARIADDGEPRFAALDALDALREASQLLQPYRDGAPLDAARSRELDKIESEAQSARDALSAAIAG